jgi:thiol-disulfide isomerase/thioredoxin
MFLLVARTLFATGLLLQVVNSSLAAAPADPLEQQLIRLGEEYQHLDEAWVKLRRQLGRPPEYSNESFTDEAWRNRPAVAGPSPAETMVPKFLDFAEQHTDSPYALDAICFMVRRGSTSVDTQGVVAQAASKAIRLATRDHLSDPRLPALLGIVDGQVNSPAADRLLHKAAEEATLPATRAAALRSLATTRHNLGLRHEWIAALESKERLTDLERTLKVWWGPELKASPYAKAATRAEIDRLLAKVESDYGDVPAPAWHFGGPGGVLLREDTQAKPQTNGQLAAALRFRIEHLDPGGLAQEIVGRDAEGTEFRLSDYRGKVVLLTFSANWCPPCRKLYPMQRALLEKFKDAPFALLSVSMDERVGTLQESLASGEINWRCWWDGREGPIHNSWNSPAAGTIVLIDAEGIIQHVPLHSAMPAEEFEAAIAGVLERPSATK